MSSKKVTTHKQILINQDDASKLPVQVSKSGVVVNSDGEYVIKAGTPLYGNLEKRDTAFTVTSTGADANKTTVQGVLYQDVPFKGSNTTENGTIVYVGTVDLLKLDTTTRALITAAVKSAIPAVHFTEGRD